MAKISKKPVTITCCELVRRMKAWDDNHKNWKGKAKVISKERKYSGFEVIRNSSSKRGVKKAKWDEELKENVYTESEEFFCEECQKWFDEIEIKFLELTEPKSEEEINKTRQEELKNFYIQAQAHRRKLDEKISNNPSSSNSTKESSYLPFILAGIGGMIIGIGLVSLILFLRKR